MKFFVSAMLAVALFNTADLAAQKVSDVMAVEKDPHPFVSKDAVDRYYRIMLECYQAQLAWRTGQ